MPSVQSPAWFLPSVGISVPMPSQYGLPSFTSTLPKMTSPGLFSTSKMTGSSSAFTSVMIPKMPFSTFAARNSPSITRKYARSSPTIFSPGIIAVAVLPQALGKAPARYVLRPLGPLLRIMNMCSASQPSLSAFRMARRSESFFRPTVLPAYWVLTLITVLRV